MAHSTSQRNCRHGLLMLLLALMLSDTIDGQFNLGQLGQQFGLGNLGGMLGGLMGGGHQQQQQPQQLQRHPNIEDRPPQGGPGPGQGPGGGNNPVGGLNVGGQVEGILNRIGLNQQFTHQLSGLINGVAANFFAPNPNSPIPPHVQRRIMRFCTRHPEFPKCQGHPEWVLQQGNVPTAPQMGNAQDTLNLNEMFPNLIPFQIPPIPQMAVRNFLAGVPDLLKQFVPPQVVGQITEFARQALTSICNQRDCLKQLPEFLNQRATVAEQEAAITRTLAPGKSVEQVDHDVELRLARTFQVKKALIRKAGLEGKVEPANNGVFQQDLLLTEEQANSILTEVNQNQVGVGVAPTGGRLKRAGNSLYLESAPNQRWPTGQPISFMFDRSVSSEVDKSAVRAALNEIQAKMGGCLRFQEANTKPAGSHLYYVKVANPVFCGLSYVGRIEPANPIYLSFMCGNPMGVAIHETLHALGLQHEQLRIDRDKFITVNWENVNPQQYDFFAVSDMTKFSSYGLKYDYGSIMHYSSTIASQNFGKKTMTAKQNPAANDAMMGQRNALSQSDIEMLKRMYCMPTCKDNNVYCGVWATSDLCRTANGAAQGWMVQNCRKSCGFCTVGTS